MSVSKATCPESVFKTIQIILWETPVTKSSRKVFKNVNLVRVLPLITNLASFFNNKFFLNSGRFVCKIFYVFSFIWFLFTVNSKYLFNSWCCILDYFILNCKLWDKFFNFMIILILIIYVLQKFSINLWIYGTEEGPHMWPKRLPCFLFEYFYIYYFYIFYILGHKLWS